MKGVERFKSRLGGNIQESMGGAVSSATASGPTLGVAHGVPARYDGVTRPKDALTIPVNKLRPDPDQPRRDFDEDDLQRLAVSLKTRGQLQPIRVRWDAEQGTWIIVSGERRWRAAAIAGVEALACVEVKNELSPDVLLEDQLIENCLRTDLKPIEQAHAFKTLMDRRAISARQLGDVLSLSHMTITRAIALLALPEPVQLQVEQGVLAPSAAYELGKIDDPDVLADIANAVVAEKLTRSEVTDLVQAVKSRRPAPATRPNPVQFDLGDGTLVQIRWKKPNATSVVSALKRALKLAQEPDRDRPEQAA
jgi:ParB family transcriptional regulator, chromosome partitioning protein